MPTPPDSGVRAAADEIVARRLDLDVIVGAAHDDRLAEHVLAHHYPVALDGFDTRADGRNGTPQLGVRLVLVAEAALEASAHAGELRRVQGEPLLLRHLDRDCLELVQPRRAAELAPAGAHA